MTEESDGERAQSITLVVSWRGGPGVDVVSLAHNQARVTLPSRTVDVGSTSAAIEYTVPVASRHEVRVALAFIGDERSDLALWCMVDGVLAGAPLRCAHAAHRWVAEGSWSLET